jgi:hypothetical protein
MRRFATAALTMVALLIGVLSMAARSQAAPLSPAQDSQPRLVIFEFISKEG